MSATFTETITLEKGTCGKCGGVYALNKSFVDHARNNRGGFNCPYCQTRWSWSESESDRLRKQIALKEQEIQRVQASALNERGQRELAETRERAAQKKLKRVTNGVCPCCNRSFANLRRHILTKHPEPSKP